MLDLVLGSWKELGNILFKTVVTICGFQLFVNFFSIGTEHSYNDMQTK